MGAAETGDETDGVERRLTEAAAPPRRRRFRTQVALATAGTAAFAAAVLVVAFHARVRQLLSAELAARAEALAGVAAASAGEGEPWDARAFAERIVLATPGAARVEVLDPGGSVVADAVAVRAPTAGVVSARRALPRGRGEVLVALDATAIAATLRALAWKASGMALLVALAGAALGAALARRLTGPVEAIAAAAERLGRGELDVEIRAGGGAEIGALGAALTRLSRSLGAMIGELRGAAEAVARQSEAVSRASRHQVQVTAGQTSAVEQTAEVVAELARASKGATASAQLVIDVASRAEETWRGGEASLRDGMAGLEALQTRVAAIAGAVTELSEKTVQIAEVVASVRDLAEQSNVLALNASIEAAQVGAEGKGFAVVAGEMRRLAQQSRHAADGVRARLVELQRATRRVVLATGEGSAQAAAASAAGVQATRTIASLATAVEESGRAARSIFDTTRRQTEEMEGIAAAVEFVRGDMGETLDGAKDVERIAEELRRLSAQLSDLVRGYGT